jgi:hypothetical protein
MNLNFWLLLPLLPFGFALYWLYKQLREIRAGRKQPISDSVSRPPGESTRLKIAELDEDLLWQVYLLVAPPIAFILAGFYGGTERIVSRMVISAVLIGTFYYFLNRKILKTLKLWRNYDLGFRGERVVGQALNELVAQGYRVFHDLQFDGFNIDHAMVGPGGVFCFETKTFRKRITADGHRITYDGKALISLLGGDVRQIEQAERNARTLQKFLADAAAEQVKVQPVLVLPGWFVDRQGRGDVMVVNHKELPQILPQETVLTPEQIQRIAHQLEQKAQMEF